MKIKHFIASLLICGLSFPLCAQLSLPIKEINGKQYYYYKVKKKETLYGIAKKYGVTQEDILKHNPSTKDGLKDKQILFFPVDDFSGKKETNAATPKITTRNISKVSHVVSKGETLYGLSKMYGISIDAITKANPDVANGLKTGQKIEIPQSESIDIVNETKESGKNSEQIIYHRISAGETLYSVSRSYNCSIESILENNPGISAQNFRMGEVIRITANQNKMVVVEKPVTKFITYVAKKGESFNSIAEDNNLDVNSLKDANPGVNKVKKGNVVTIPVTDKEEVVINQNQIPEDKVNISSSAHYINITDTVNVAVILPFMLHEAKPSVTALNNTEFLKGFLLAINNVRNSTTKHINVFTYDNKNSVSTTDSILRIAELKSMDIIIAPSEAKQLEATNRFCKDNEILAINALNVKDQSHVSNPYAFQLNIPANYMSASINEWYDSKFKGYKAIFIDAEKETKKDVSESLKKHLASQNIKYTTIVVDSYFGFDQVNDQINPGDKCVTIPTSGSKALLAKLAPILKTIKQDRIDVDLVLFGHPEYTTYLMEHQADLHKINTYIYSRFYYDSNDVATKAIEEEYKKWYGEEMRYNVPRLGLFGYDTGMFFIKALCNNHQQFNDRIIDTHIGAQTTFKMERLSNWSGFTNKDLQFIHFTPQQTIEKLH